ncbi:MAG: CAP domain-containing protein [Panacagrimonas sp.]
MPRVRNKPIPGQAWLLTAVVVGACAGDKTVPLASGGEPQEMAGMLAAHNHWRAQVGVAPLNWSPAAAEQAQDWADQLAQVDGCELSHNPDPDRQQRFGENIYRAGDIFSYKAYQATPEQVVAHWADERQWYDPQTGSCSAPDGETCGHYTQLVWSHSFSVGCGRARCQKLEVWVCNYAPGGNWDDRKAY